MAVERVNIDIDSLSREQKLDLLERLWDSLNEEPEELPVPDWHLALVEERIDAFERDGDRGAPAEDVLARLRGRSE